MILAIDPGNIQSAYVLMDGYTPVQFDKVDNEVLVDLLPSLCVKADEVVIEMIGHYGSGMSAGKTVFDTCVWIGRFWQQCNGAQLILRPTIKTAICGTPRAKDSNVIQALKDRFGEKGTKADKGFFWGFHHDIWQSFAVGCAWLDLHGGTT